MEFLLEEKQSKFDRIETLNAFIVSLEDKATIIDEFSTDLWNLMIQDALVNEDGTITFKFRNGNEVRILSQDTEASSLLWCFLLETVRKS